MIYVGTAGSGVFRSTDGATWPSSGPRRAAACNTVVQAIAVDATNPQSVYAGTASGIYVSNNGGAAWTLSGLPGTQ